MPVDSNGNFGYYPGAPPYSMGRKEYRKWLKKTKGSLKPERWKK